MEDGIPLLQLRTVSVVLLGVHVLDLFVPWSRVLAPSILKGTGQTHADIGLVHCVSGNLCTLFNSLNEDSDSSKSLPPWMEGPLDDEIKKSPIYTANVVTVCLIMASAVCLVLAEVIGSHRSSWQVRGINFRVALTLGSCVSTIFAAVLYMALIHRSLNGGQFLLGVYLTIGAGILCLTFALYSLTTSSDAQVRQYAKPAANDTIRHQHDYGAINRL